MPQTRPDFNVASPPSSCNYCHRRFCKLSEKLKTRSVLSVEWRAPTGLLQKHMEPTQRPSPERRWGPRAFWAMGFMLLVQSIPVCKENPGREPGVRTRGKNPGRDASQRAEEASLLYGAGHVLQAVPLSPTARLFVLSGRVAVHRGPPAAPRATPDQSLGAGAARRTAVLHLQESDARATRWIPETKAAITVKRELNGPTATFSAALFMSLIYSNLPQTLNALSSF
ncbi:hypothetical protein EYF80_060411 [Liparis tanakae]|uniref:Uncharacterized protein n=1 Tax=Liparis tanakae TaxID=230148 RepID=A0A4Z2ELJ4_9TELE|nr:hypothetical protein EYF80_060411 [Liparis tanakae]